MFHNQLFSLHIPCLFLNIIKIEKNGAFYFELEDIKEVYSSQ